jgi:hypothetical protein
VSSLLVLTAVRRLDAQTASPAAALSPQAGAVPCQGHDVIASGGTPLPGAAIAIKDAVRTVAVTSTDVDGSYAFALSPGIYNVLSQCGLRAPRLRRFSRIAEGHFVDTTDSIQRHFVEPWKARFLLQIDPRHRRRRHAECAQPTNATITPAAPDPRPAARGRASCRTSGLVSRLSAARTATSRRRRPLIGVMESLQVRTTYVARQRLIGVSFVVHRVTRKRHRANVAKVWPRHCTNGHDDTAVGKCRRTTRVE